MGFFEFIKGDANNCQVCGRKTPWPSSNLYDLSDCTEVVQDIKDDLEDEDVQDESVFRFKYDHTPSRSYDLRKRISIDYSPKGQELRHRTV
jgi:hypothetical protein